MLHPVRSVVLSLPLAALLTGCALETTAVSKPDPIPGPAISGVAHGGSQPITGAKVYLLAANPSGYGNSSLSLLTAASTGNAADSVGSYVTTALVTGSFNLAPAGNADFDCTQGYALGANTSTATPTNLIGNEQVYLYIIKGGNAGGGTNNNIGLLAALGPCNNIYSNSITVNELTTVAAAYAFAGYATNATSLSSSGSALAIVGLSNAGLNSANLVNAATGLPVASDSATTRPVATLYTLGDILAACVNGKSGNTNCSTLFTYTQSAGTTGTTPAETATAAINLAHNPWPTSTGMTALYGLQPATGAPFAGGLSTQPNDFTVGLSYSGGALKQPESIAIDGAGNAWIANYTGTSVTEFSSTGTLLSGASGYTGGGESYGVAIAIDALGNAWTANNNGSVSKFSSNGAAVSPSAGYTGAGLNSPVAIAIDTAGDAWIANFGGNSLSEFSSNGTALSSTNGITGGGLNKPQGVAIDAAGNVWAANVGNNSLSKFSSSGTAVSSSSGYTGGGLLNPESIAIDISGNAWAASKGNNTLSKFSNSGTAVSSSSGYTGGGLTYPDGIAIDGSGNAWTYNYNVSSISEFSSAGNAITPTSGYTGGNINGAFAIALDGSGDVWVANNGGGYSITELIGAASPVVTPVVANLKSPYNAPASKP